MDLNQFLNEGFCQKKKSHCYNRQEMQRHYLMKPHKEVLTGSLPTVSKGSGKTIVFILSSELTEIVLKQKWETINEI